MTTLSSVLGGTHAAVAVHSRLKSCRDLLEPLERDFAEFEPEDLSEVEVILEEAKYQIQQVQKLVRLLAVEMKNGYRIR